MQQQVLEGFKLSPQQKHLWSFYQAGACEPFRAQSAISIEGQLDAELLKRAIESVLARHEVLRTTFQYLPGMTIPLQVIIDGAGLAHQEFDLSSSGSSEQEAIVECLLEDFGRQFFDLERGPLLHTSLIKLNARRHLLLNSLPSMCADTRALGNLAEEIARCYAALAQGDELTGEPGQYVDYAEWQNDLLKAEETEKGRAFWQRPEATVLPPMKLPCEMQAGGELNFKPEMLTSRVSPDVSAKMEVIAKERGVSTADFLLACWQALLFRQMQTTEMVVGVAFDGRKHEGQHKALGLYAKHLPLDYRPGERLRFADLLQQTGASTRALYRWQEYFAFEKSMEANDDPAAPSFFPICFEFDEQPSQYNAAGATFTILRQQCCFSPYKLKLRGVQREDGLLTELHFDSALFRKADMQRLADELQQLLKSAVQSPEALIGELDILSRTERQQLLVDFNDTQEAFPEARCIHHLFEQQAERTPEQAAVVFEAARLSYAELNKRANQVAHYLQRLGIEPESRVAICVERSVEMLIGILGILKAGGAYVPLDPMLPVERRIFMMEDAQASLLLTQERLAQSFPTQSAIVMCLDTDREAIERESQQNPESNVRAGNLVYVIYTSGSTGQPKGVAVEHRQLTNYVSAIARRFKFAPGASFATVSTIAADLGHTALYPTLCSGGCLHVISQERATDPAALAEYFSRHNIDCLKIVPSHFATLLRHHQPGKLMPRRLLVLGGEASDREWIDKLRELAGDCAIFNHYGPTEATVGVLTYRVGQESQEQSGTSLPLGRPIANTQIYLLDSHLRPVPLGVNGELYIGGDCLSRGYLNRPELNAEMFVPNPFSAAPGTRLYRTGDLARYLPDGNIEFLGRLDHQVKVRGYRIEPGEIEAVLRQHPQVLESVVVVREDVPGDKRLIAYLTQGQRSVSSVEDPARHQLEDRLAIDGEGTAEADSKQLTSHALRDFVKERLPEYMIPAAFVVMGALPLTLNGKLDRQALPIPEAARVEGDGRAALSLTEELLKTIWEQVLGVEGIGSDDNFFALGGHSLLAAQVITRLQAVFQSDLPLRLLFEAPTLAGLATAIEAALSEGSDLQLPPLLPVGHDNPIPLSFAQQRLWFLDQFEPESPLYNIFIAIRLEGSLHVAALEQTLSEIVKRHESLRTTFRMQDEHPVQVISPAGIVTLNVTSLEGLRDSEREAEAHRLALEEARRPFNLAAGPLLRASLLRLSEQEHVLLLNMHHIISDGWSMGVLAREVAVLYESFISGNASSLPALPVQYADYAVWQREWLQGETLERQTDYWRRHLSGLAELKLPAQKPRPGTIGQSGAVMTFVLDETLTGQLKALCAQESVTLFMLLLAAFQTLLHQYTGQEDIVLCTDSANRKQAATEELIGFFVNQLVIRTDLSGKPTFRELLGRVREVALNAYAHQDVPFEKLVEILNPDRTAHRTPLFQAKLVLQNAPMRPLKMAGLSLSQMNIEEGTQTAKFDLLLTFVDTRQGLACNLEYSTDIFTSSEIERIKRNFENLLRSIVAQPDVRINALEIVSLEEKKQQAVEETKIRENKFRKFKTVKPKTVSLPRAELMRTGHLNFGETLPLVIEPNTADIDLIGWVTTNRSAIQQQLLEYGGLLFRGFGLNKQEDFEQFTEANSIPLMQYMEGATPRTKLGDKVYTSTEYPADHAIALHNELTYVSTWPMKIWFFCIQPAEQQGETPIADVRKVFKRIDPKIRERFDKKGWMLVRNFGEGLSLPWQSSFHVETRAELEAYCRSASIDFEWKPDNSLRTRQVRPAVTRHPQTNELVWFNHVAFWHVSSLDAKVREAMLELYDEQDLAYNTYYGDGTRIESSVIDEIRAAYDAETIAFPWQRGDILMLDNMLVAHGRSPFVGPRKVLVSMGEAYTRRDI